MRRFLMLIVIATTAVGLFGTGAASAKAKPPVTLTGKVNVHAKKDVSGSAKATIELEQDDFYFSPTFIKVQPGEQLTLKVKNEGSTDHTFTSSILNVDKTLSSDTSKTIKVTIPTTGTVFQFHCDFHEAMGMQGAFYVAGASTSTTAAP
jgi:plastocyanin